MNDYLDFAVPSGRGSVPVTLRRLLSHQSGFGDRKGGIAALSGKRLPLGPYLARHMPPRLNRSEKTVEYSNYNAALAAYMIERASGQQFESYLKDNVFTPLQMTRSTAVQPLPEEFLPQVSKGYMRSDQPPTAISMTSETVYEVGAAKVRASSSDMGRLMLALLQQVYV